MNHQEILEADETEIRRMLGAKQKKPWEHEWLLLNCNIGLANWVCNRCGDKSNDIRCPEKSGCVPDPVTEPLEVLAFEWRDKIVADRSCWYLWHDAQTELFKNDHNYTERTATPLDWLKAVLIALELKEKR